MSAPADAWGDGNELALFTALDALAHRFAAADEPRDVTLLERLHNAAVDERPHDDPITTATDAPPSTRGSEAPS